MGVGEMQVHDDKRFAKHVLVWEIANCILQDHFQNNVTRMIE